jgi:hypothetical protein
VRIGILAGNVIATKEKMDRVVLVASILLPVNVFEHSVRHFPFAFGGYLRVKDQIPKLVRELITNVGVRPMDHHIFVINSRRVSTVCNCWFRGIGGLPKPMLNS